MDRVKGIPSPISLELSMPPHSGIFLSLSNRFLPFFSVFLRALRASVVNLLLW